MVIAIMHFEPHSAIDLRDRCHLRAAWWICEGKVFFIQIIVHRHTEPNNPKRDAAQT